VPGIASKHVFSVDEILEGERPSGKRILVIDGNGHWEAAGTIEYLLEAGFGRAGCDRRSRAVGINIEGANVALFQQRSAKLGLKTWPFSRLDAVEEGGARLANLLTGEAFSVAVDAVGPAIAGGSLPRFVRTGRRRQRSSRTGRRLRRSAARAERRSGSLCPRALALTPDGAELSNEQATRW
jgi:hypothetical protein